jgi:hypothetical protein
LHFFSEVHPQPLNALAAWLVWLGPSKIVKKNRDSGEWGIQEILA